MKISKYKILRYKEILKNFNSMIAMKYFPSILNFNNQTNLVNSYNNNNKTKRITRQL